MSRRNRQRLQQPVKEAHAHADADVLRRAAAARPAQRQRKPDQHRDDAGKRKRELEMQVGFEAGRIETLGAQRADALRELADAELVGARRFFAELGRRPAELDVRIPERAVGEAAVGREPATVPPLYTQRSFDQVASLISVRLVRRKCSSSPCRVMPSSTLLVASK